MSRAAQPAGYSTVPYDHIPLQPVDSSQIAGIGYDANRETLAVQFKHGHRNVYHYPGVPPEVHAEFMASSSKGTFFGKRISPLAFEKYPDSVLEPLPAVSLLVTEIAQKLHGMEYPMAVPNRVAEDAKASGIVIVYGASDDLMEFDGAFRDEAGACDGTTVLLDAKGVLPSWEEMQHEHDEARHSDYHARKQHAVEIEAVWCPKDMPGTSWAYKTAIPHATFDIIEDGDIYCRGIVFSLADIPART